MKDAIIFHAKTQSEKPRTPRKLCAFAPLRLCV